MRTSTDRGTPRRPRRRRKQTSKWKSTRTTGYIILGVVVLCLIIGGVIGWNNRAPVGAKPPEIVSFQGTPPENEGDAASYTFEVKNASKIKLIETGETIKEINGPSSGIYKGDASGRPGNWVLTSDNSTFDAVLEASNDYGTVRNSATLSSLSALRTLPPSKIQDQPCPYGCHCLKPADAQAQGLTNLCSGSGGQPLECQSPFLVHNASTIKYCYKIPVQPCDTASGCHCLKPSQAPPGYYAKCSDNQCAANPDAYCYRLKCTTCGNCLPDSSVSSSCNFTQCSSNACNSPGEPDAHCYKCPSGNFCMTPAYAASQGLDISDPSPCSCGVEFSSGNIEYCYHYSTCDNTTGCSCWPDQYINANCQGSNGYMFPCSDNQCAEEMHCYSCPPNCKCFQDSDPNRLALNYTVQCTSGNCICKETPAKDYHCYHRPGT